MSSVQRLFIACVVILSTGTRFAYAQKPSQQDGARDFRKLVGSSQAKIEASVLEKYESLMSQLSGDPKAAQKTLGAEIDEIIAAVLAEHDAPLIAEHHRTQAIALALLSLPTDERRLFLRKALPEDDPFDEEDLTPSLHSFEAADYLFPHISPHQVPQLLKKDAFLLWFARWIRNETLCHAHDGEATEIVIIRGLITEVLQSDEDGPKLSSTTLRCAFQLGERFHLIIDYESAADLFKYLEIDPESGIRLTRPTDPFASERLSAALNEEVYWLNLFLMLLDGRDADPETKDILTEHLPFMKQDPARDDAFQQVIRGLITGDPSMLVSWPPDDPPVDDGGPDVWP